MKLLIKSTWFKIISVTFIASALAAYLGFIGTHYLFNKVFEYDKRHNDLVVNVGKIVRGIKSHSNLTYEKIEEIYNEDAENPFKISIRPKIEVLEAKELKFNQFKVIEIEDGIRSSYFALDEENILILNVDKMRHFGQKLHSKHLERKRDSIFGKFLPGPPPMGGPGKNPNLILVPVTLTFLIMFIVLLIVSFVLYTFSKKYADSAKEILIELKKGNLKARLPEESYNELSEVKDEFNEMASEIEKLVNNLKETDQIRKNLLQELAHDLRTPIASMKSLVETNLNYDERLSADQRKENLNLALKENEYFEHLVEDLLFLSGVNDFKYKGNFTKVNLEEIIQHEVDILSFKNKKIKIEFNSCNNQYVYGDYHLIQRLLKNALTNATSHAKEKVIIKCGVAGDKFKLTITDDGKGLGDDDLTHFGKKRFSRKISHYEDGRISIGLGAVIMSKICEIHEGSIKIINNIDDVNKILGASLIIELKNYEI